MTRRPGAIAHLLSNQRLLLPLFAAKGRLMSLNNTLTMTLQDTGVGIPQEKKRIRSTRSCRPYLC